MAKFYSPVDTTDTFQTWLDRTNTLTNDLATVIITTDGTAAGALTSGNAQINGNVDADVGSFTSIKGGTNTTTAALAINSDVDMNFDANVDGDFFDNGGTFNVAAGTLTSFYGDINIFGPTLDVSAVTTFTNPVVADITGNASSSSTADAWTNAGTVTLGGDVSGSFTVDGSGDVTTNITVTNAPQLADNDILTKLSNVDGAGSGLDADLFDGLESTQFARKDQSETFAGSVSMKDRATIVDNVGVTWSISAVASEDAIVITRNGTRLFKLDFNGNLVVKGDITAFGTV